MSTNNRRTLGLLSTAILGAGLAVMPLSVQPAGAVTDVTINLLNFNDFHGRIADKTTVQFAGTIEKARAEHGEANSLVLSAGDNIGASLFASATQADQPTIDVLNALDVKASAVGNHEFDLGFADLTDRVIGKSAANAAWTYLGANVYQAGTTTPALPEYSIHTVGGVTVGVIGAVTQQTPSLVAAGGIKSVTFGDAVEAVNRVAAKLSDGNPANGEAQVLVAEYHDGAAAGTPATLDERLAADAAFAKIVNQTSPEVDVLFTAHTHMSYAWDATIGSGPATRPVLQAGSYGDRIGQVVLTFDTAAGAVKSYTQQLITRSTDTVAELTAAYPRAKAVDDLTKAALSHADQVGSVQVAKQTADITTAFSGGNYVEGRYTGGTRDDRSKESAMGTLIADSLLDTLAKPALGGAQIGIVNPGGMRSELYYKAGAATGDAAGTIIRAEANQVLPFVNNLWTTTLTGEQLRSVLEQQWQPAGASRPYLQLGLSSNMTYTYDPAAAPGQRIRTITVNGKAVRPTDNIRVGSFSFLLDGGDNFTAFKQGKDTKDSGLVDYQAWIDYLGSQSPLVPSFAKHAAAVSSPATAKVGEAYTLKVSQLDLTSLGAPANTTLTITVGGTPVAGEVRVLNGAAEASFVLPNSGEAVLTAQPSGTVVRGAFTVTKADATPLNPNTKARVRKGNPYSFTVELAEIGNWVWPTGTLRSYVNGKLVDTQTLVASEKGRQRITLTAADLKSIRRGKTVTVTTKLTSSSTVNTATLRTIKLTIS